MTRNADIERLLDTWLLEGPSEIPDRAIAAVADRIERQSQRSRWRLRLVHGAGHGRLRLLVAAAAILVAVVGAAVVGRLSAPTVGAPTPSPSVTPGSTPAPPRTYSSEKFGITYELPLGWVTNADTPAWFLLGPAAAAESLEGVFVFREPAILDQDAECSQVAKPGVGHTVNDFIDYLTTHPGLIASGPVQVTISGLSGVRVDLALAPTWTQTCPWNGNGVPTVMYLTQDSGRQSYFFAVEGVERQRAAFLDDGNGGVVGVMINGRGVDRFAQILEEAGPILDSLVIERRPHSTSAPTSSPSPNP